MGETVVGDGDGAVAAAALLIVGDAEEEVEAGSGVQHMEAVTRGEAKPPPPGVLPVKFVGGLLSLGAGIALGREGSTVEMDSAIESRCGRWLRLSEDDIRCLQAATADAFLGPPLHRVLDWFPTIRVEYPLTSGRHKRVLSVFHVLL
ncbi:MAG: chloride channel protein [Anaerolineae bacterium]